MKLSTGLAVLFLAGSSFQALAAATPEEAARLTAVMQSYVGNEPGVVTVTPNGESYNTRLDFAPLIAKIKQTGFAASVTPIDMTLTPQGNGKWKVDQDQPLAFSMKVDGQIEMKGSVAAIKGSGIFDEALGGFEFEHDGIQPVRLRPDGHREQPAHARDLYHRHHDVEHRDGSGRKRR